MSGRNVKKWLAVLRPLLATAAAAALPVAGVTLLVLRGDELGAWAEARSPLELSLWILVATLFCCGLALLPTHAVSLVAGWGLGAVLGVPVAWVSIMLAVTLSFGVGRVLAGTGLVNGLRGSPARRAVYDALVRASPGRTTGLVALLRLSPLAPFAATNVALAGLGLSWRPVLLGSALGLTPRVVVVALLGAGSAQIDFSAPGAPLLFIAGVIAAIAALVWTAQISRTALRRATRDAQDPLPLTTD